MERIVVIVAATLLLAAVVCAQADDKAKAVEVFNECREKIKASEEDVAPMINKKPPTTEKGKCVVACMMEKGGVINSEGKYDADKGRAMIERYLKDDPAKQEAAKKAADECAKEVEDAKLTNKCDVAAKLAECFKKKVPATADQ